MKRLIFILLSIFLFAGQSQAQWFENFDSNMSLPSGWNVINQGGDQGWEVSTLGTSDAHSPGNVVQILYNSYHHDDYLITPRIENVNDDNYLLSFWVKSHKENSLEPFDVRISTTGNIESSDFTTILVEEQYAPPVWTKIEVDLTDYMGQNVYVAIHATGVNNWLLYVDDVKNYGIVLCPVATGLTEDNITQNSATLSWETDENVVEWEVIYGHAGFSPETQGTTINVSENTCDLTNLDHSTQYDWYVRAMCGELGVAQLSEKKSFQTNCYTISSFPFEEDFSGYIIPPCWSQEYVVGDQDWIIVNGEAKFKDGTNNETTKLITPSLDISNLNNPTLIFKYRKPAYDFVTDELRIYYKNSLSDNWGLLATYTDIVENIVTEVIELPDASSEYYIAFEAKTKDGFSTYIDNVVVKDFIDQPIIEVNPTSYNFGNVYLGHSASHTFTIRNIGTLDLEISEITLSEDEVFTTDAIPNTIAAGESYTFNVIFTPLVEGTVNGTLAIVNNSSNPSVSINIKGTGKEEIIIPEIAFWEGNKNNDWFEPSNWNVNAVPGNITSVIIPLGLDNYPTISSEAICRKITFEQGATLLGFQYLTVLENAFYNQILIGDVSAKADENVTYHYVSSPVANPTAGTVFPSSSLLRKYNEITQMWENLSSTNIMEVGKGYSLWLVNGEVDITYKGALNNSGVYFNGLTLSNDFDNYSGWHLLGNPYPAAIDMDNISFPNNMQNSVCVWSNDNGGYINWNGSVGDLTEGIIPVGQGFFVKVNQNNVSFSVFPEDCIHNNTEVYKNRDVDVMAINVENNENHYNETAYITFASDGDNGYDRFDVIKLNGLNGAPELYTMIDDKLININSRYSADDMTLYFKTNIEGTFTLEIKDFSLQSDEITIEDRLTGNVIEAKEGEKYEFTGNADDDITRFVIHFNGVVDINETDLNLNIFENNHQVVVNNQTGEKLMIEIYNINGQLIEMRKTHDVETRFSLPSTGMYLIKAINSNVIISEKIIIEE